MNSGDRSSSPGSSRVFEVVLWAHVHRPIAQGLANKNTADEFFYISSKDDDRPLYAGMLERKRDDMVRSAVLYMHTAIEDLINSQVIRHILDVKLEDRRSQMRSQPGRTLRKMLFGGGSLGST